MSQTLLKPQKANETKIYYYNPKEKFSIHEFSKTLSLLIQQKSKKNQEIILYVLVNKYQIQIRWTPITIIILILI